METFEFDGKPIAYIREGAGPPVVMLHNGGTSHAIWRHQIRALSRNHQVFALDLLGYGASARPATGYTLGEYVDCLAAFVDEKKNLAPVALVGNCMGSAISLSFAMRRPADVRSLVLINPLTERTISDGGVGALPRLTHGFPAVAGPVTSFFSGLRVPRWAVTPMMRLQLGTAGRAAGVHRDPALRACWTRPGQLRSLIGVLWDLPAYGALDRARPGPGFPPVTVVYGRRNRVLARPAELSLRLAPDREEVLEDCGHLPMLELPDAITKIIEESVELERV